jgi:polyphosphate kinase 2 (PPK2 family)
METINQENTTERRGEVSKLKRFVMRNTLLAVLFHRDIEAGQTYIFRDHTDDPFKKDKLIVEIMGVKNGWVNYRHVGSSMWTNESMKRDSFNYCYMRDDA